VHEMKRVGRKSLTVPGGLLLGAGVAVNLLAYRHARAFTTFEESGSRTPQPEHLTPGQKLTTLFTGPTLPKPRNEQTPADVGLRDGPLLLYGVSMGAAAILRAVAVEDVSADALVLEMPFDRMLGTVENRFERLGAPAFPGAQLLLYWGGRQQAFDPFTHNPIDYAARVDLPTLMMHGEEDRRVTLQEARSIYEALRGPKRFVAFPKAAHETLAASDPERWKSAVGGIETLTP